MLSKIPTSNYFFAVTALDEVVASSHSEMLVDSVMSSYKDPFGAAW